MWQISMPRLNLTGLEYPLINKFVSISYVISTDLTIKIYILDTWKAKRAQVFHWNPIS